MKKLSLMLSLVAIIALGMTTVSCKSGNTTNPKENVSDSTNCKDSAKCKGHHDKCKMHENCEGDSTKCKMNEKCEGDSTKCKMDEKCKGDSTKCKMDEKCMKDHHDKCKMHEGKAKDDDAKSASTSGYTCPMACLKGKVYNEPGKCPNCGMDLVKVENK